MIERYTLKEMGDLWSEENKFRTWLEVELEAAHAMASAALAQSARGPDPFGYRAEFITLVRLAKSAAAMERLK